MGIRTMMQTAGRTAEPERDDPLKLIEQVLRALRHEDRDAAIERLIRDLEDERAVLLAKQLDRH